MAAGRAYVVGRILGPAELSSFLRLEGPFAYPRWVLDPSQATRLPGALAAQWAEAVRGLRHDEEILILPFGVSQAQAEDEAPDTRPETCREVSVAPLFADAPDGGISWER